MGRHDRQRATQQDDQVIVILIIGRIEQKHIRKPDREQGAGQAIETSGGDRYGKYSEAKKVQIHSDAGPRMHPVKRIVSEVEFWLDVVIAHAATSEIIPSPPGHDRAKPHSKENEAGNIDWGQKSA